MFLFLLFKIGDSLIFGCYCCVLKLEEAGEHCSHQRERAPTPVSESGLLLSLYPCTFVYVCIWPRLVAWGMLVPSQGLDPRPSRVSC